MRRTPRRLPGLTDPCAFVCIASGEVVLVLDLAARHAARRARRLREVLSVLDVAYFVDRWCTVDLDAVDATYRGEE